MNRILAILRFEIYALLSRPSYWLAVLGVPAVAFLVYSLVAVINTSQTPAGARPVEGISQLFEPADDARPQGFVDPHGLASALPPWFDGDGLRRYEQESAARRDLENGAIGAYYLIPEDYVATGQMQVFIQEYSLVHSGDRSAELHNLIAYNLLGQEPGLASAVLDPLPVEQMAFENLSPPAGPVRERDSSLTFFLPYGVMMLFYITIMGASGMLLNSVTKEKENRVLEIIMLSVTPHQLLLGKIAGLGLVGLLQVGIWGLSAFNLLRLSGRAFSLSEAFLLDVSILGWGALFFVLGYLVYASLMAGIGALVPNLREASQATTLVIMPLIIPLFFISGMILAPNGPLTTFFSLFPLTAPTTMMMRLAATDDVPLWQILLSAGLLAVTALLVIRAVAGMFRAQSLLSGQGFSVRRYLRALAGK